MTDRDRLMELLKTPNKTAILRKTNPRFVTEETDEESIVADYLLANGVIVPPCKVGDVVYIERICGLKEDNSPIFKLEQGTVYKIEVDNTKDTIWIGANFGILYCCRPYTDFYYSKEEYKKSLKYDNDKSTTENLVKIAVDEYGNEIPYAIYDTDKVITVPLGSKEG